MDIPDAINRLYENFFYRDLTYIFSGFLILLTLRYTFKDADIFNYLFDYLNLGENDWFKLIIVFAVSYFVGLIVKEGLVADRKFWVNYSNSRWDKFLKKIKWIEFLKWISWFNTYPPEIKGYDKTDYFRLMKNIEFYYGISTIKRLSRVDYFRHISASIGVASCISGFFLFIGFVIYLLDFGIFFDCYIELSQSSYCNYIVPVFIMTVTCYLCWKENKWKNKQYGKLITDLSSKFTYY